MSSLNDGKGGKVEGQRLKEDGWELWFERTTKTQDKKSQETLLAINVEMALDDRQTLEKRRLQMKTMGEQLIKHGSGKSASWKTVPDLQGPYAGSYSLHGCKTSQNSFINFVHIQNLAQNIFYTALISKNCMANIKTK